MRKIWLFAITLWLQTVYAADPFCTAHPGVCIKDENWDTGTPTNGWPNTPGSSWVGSSGTGPAWHEANNGGNPVNSLLDANPPCGSRGRSYRQVKGANKSEVHDQVLDFAATKEVGLRFNLCVSTNFFNNANPDGNTDSNIHFLFFNSALSGQGERLDIKNYMNQDMGSGNPAYTMQYPAGGTTYTMRHSYPPECFNQGTFHHAGFSYAIGGVDVPGFDSVSLGITPYSPSSDCVDLGLTALANQWVPVELYYKIISRSPLSDQTCKAGSTVVPCPGLGFVTLKVNGKTLLNNHAIPTDRTSHDCAGDTICKMILSGWDSTITGQIDYWIDDIVLTNSYDNRIGPPGGGTANPPPLAAPRNLKLI